MKKHGSSIRGFFLPSKSENPRGSQKDNSQSKKEGKTVKKQMVRNWMEQK